jgi:hypothetical protein
MRWGVVQGVLMVCYQVTAQFAFPEEPLGSHKPVLVSAHIKKQKAKAFLIPPCLAVSNIYFRKFHNELI